MSTSISSGVALLFLYFFDPSSNLKFFSRVSAMKSSETRDTNDGSYYKLDYGTHSML